MIIAWTIYLVWAVTTLGWLITASWLAIRKRFSKLNYFILIPIVTIIPFSYVFIFNAGSNVAQFTDRKDLWSFWFECYLPLFFGNAIGSACFLISLIVPLFWKRMRGDATWYFKLVMFGSMALSLFHILTTMPDA
jgi:hypothetical protein